MPAARELYEATGRWNDHWGRVKTLGGLITLAGAATLFVGGLLVRQFGAVGTICIGFGILVMVLGFVGYVDRRREERARGMPVGAEASSIDRIDLLRQLHADGSALRRDLIWPKDGIPETAQDAAAQAAEARSAVCDWAKDAWMTVRDQFPGYERDFYGPSDLVDQSLFHVACDEEIDRLGGTNAFFEQRMELLQRLLKKFDAAPGSERESASPAPREAFREPNQGNDILDSPTVR